MPRSKLHARSSGYSACASFTIGTATSTSSPSHRSFVVKDELILVLDDGDRDAEFYRRTRLAFGNPARVFLEDRKDLLRVRNRLVLQKPALNLIDLTPGMSDEALDGLTRAFRDAPVP